MFGCDVAEQVGMPYGLCDAYEMCSRMPVALYWCEDCMLEVPDAGAAFDACV